MKFLIDAQLPKRLAGHLSDLGHDAIHTLDLPGGNRTTDAEIRSRADREKRAVVTKDADFVDSHILEDSPERLILISTGNIANPALFTLINSRLPGIVSAFESSSFIELTSRHLITH